MSDEYIRKDVALDSLKAQADTMRTWVERYAEQRRGILTAVNIIEDVEPADVVSVSAYKQVMWERDTAVEQLKQIGKGLGEVMDDVVPVVHGKWLPIVSYNNTYKCSECGRLLVNITDGLNTVAKHYPYCHCGAKMDEKRKKVGETND